ncbi:MAG: deoxynucleoside kinase [Deltaproteobacteria bacterium CG_4_10_14_0_2_um_filter_43_8]|nr:MAG: deoxynucleoside kinase [Deltaproteobacteria bacterium CG11_big_fil_rev_8_21_14_0_20_42_23]PJA20549.1 MAG: deoxynucleoside kinase [Deltaproteobacteria bacterium CG_4_10_14_0_2_um_filter_43_8]PJC65216.1 MAG: deoxynucleoside kinase [Deltaproteobacteria bacterium CG_4_9_14_0_2_um_filter_42_21]
MATQKYIAVAGNIGAGKSSLIDFLCSEYSVKPFFEQNDNNPFFGLFYKNMKRWAFHSQMFFLTQKFKSQLELQKAKGTVIQDRTIYEDAEIFAHNLYVQKHMSKEEYNTYSDLYQSILRTIRPPDLLIFVDCSVKTLLKRIEKRGRDSEQSIPLDYLKGLHRSYRKWIKAYSHSPVLVYSSEKIDYLSDFVHRHDLLQKIEKYL